MTPAAAGRHPERMIGGWAAGTTRLRPARPYSVGVISADTRRRRLTRFVALSLTVILTVSGGVAAAAWSALGPRYALAVGALAALEGVAVLVVAAVAARRNATRARRAAETWERHHGPIPHEPVPLHGTASARSHVRVRGF